jgi:hypothetical protein
MTDLKLQVTGLGFHKGILFAGLGDGSVALINGMNEVKIASLPAVK